jgi:hypothetical protein
VKIEGVKRLLKQLDDLPDDAYAALHKSVERSVALGVSKAKAIAPVDSGDFKSGINGSVTTSPDRIVGFVNFYEGDNEEGLAANAINYGWGPSGSPSHTRETTKSLIAARHRRAAQRQLRKAIEKALR